MFLTALLWMLEGIGGFFTLLYIYRTFTLGICRSQKRLDEKTVFITGGNAGIGFETARDLAKRGARVIISSRSKDRGMAAVAKIKTMSGSQNVDMVLLDLADFASVRECAQTLHKMVEKIDILVNNAGTAPVEDKHLTIDDYDHVLQSNHFGPFLLTHLIKDLLEKSDERRIVHISSLVARMIMLDFSQIRKGVEYERKISYHASKLMNCMFSYEIARNWRGFKSYSLHPGMVKTDIFNKADTSKQGKLAIFIMNSMVGIYGKTSEQGAQTTLHCCLEDNLINGEYYADCKRSVSYLRPDMETENFRTQAKKLWTLSEQFTGL